MCGDTMKVAIIGGGASGVLAAIRLKEINKKIDVTILERESKILTKVLRSGNGRANFGNLDIDEKYYTNQELIIKMQSYLASKNIDDSNAFMENHGLLTYTDLESRLYPYSNDAKTLVSLLEYLLFLNKVRVINNVNITNIEKNNDKYVILNEEYDYVVIAIGSNASLKYDNSNQYALLDNMGVETVNLEPGLSGFKCYNDFSSLFGLRVKAELTLNNFTSYGEIIFKEDGINGICLMNLSNYYNGEEYIDINLLPDIEIQEFYANLVNRIKYDPNIRLYNLAIGTVNNKILNYINKNYKNEIVSKLTKEELIQYINEFYHFRVYIKEKYDYKNAQIILGGINENEIDFFKLKKYDKVFATGEVLDNAGICGGYNLWFAFTSGLIVANMIGEDKND